MRLLRRLLRRFWRERKGRQYGYREWSVCRSVKLVPSSEEWEMEITEVELDS
jgi:hypothetical protein